MSTMLPAGAAEHLLAYYGFRGSLYRHYLQSLGIVRLTVYVYIKSSFYPLAYVSSRYGRVLYLGLDGIPDCDGVEW